MRARTRVSFGDIAAGSATLVTVLVIEALRLNAVYVVTPFLAVFATMAASAAARGLLAGSIGGATAGAYTIYAAVVGFGPETLTGGPVQVAIGLAIIATLVISIGRMKDQSTRLIDTLAVTRDRLRERTRALEHQVAEKTADYVRMTARVFQIQESERANLSRELHDEFGQLLVSLKLALARLRSTPGAEETLKDADGILDHLLQQTRSLSLLLQPVLLDGPGISVAIRRYVEQQAIRAGWEYSLDVDELPRNLHKTTLLLCFRCVQEALTNAVKYADASRVSVVLEYESGRIRIEIEDDGKGFDVPERWRVGEQGGLGIPGMIERFRAAGGEVSVRSRPGAGTRISARVPAALDDETGGTLERRAAG